MKESKEEEETAETTSAATSFPSANQNAAPAAKRRRKLQKEDTEHMGPRPEGEPLRVFSGHTILQAFESSLVNQSERGGEGDESRRKRGGGILMTSSTDVLCTLSPIFPNRNFFCSNKNSCKS
jgi:hypothetical protein